jgi:GNAT superfamily N-acetyltransferase
LGEIDKIDMMFFTNPSIQFANKEDIIAIKHLLNAAYRGDSSRKGWTHEADLIGGDVRTDDNNVREVMDLPGSIFLKYLDEDGSIIGCVNLQNQGANLYLGMFSVRPEIQGKGLGKALLAAADEYAGYLGIARIKMTVISVRAELIAWYNRNGYLPTGELIPFHEDSLTGNHLQPLFFAVLVKEFDV